MWGQVAARAAVAHQVVVAAIVEAVDHRVIAAIAEAVDHRVVAAIGEAASSLFFPSQYLLCCTYPPSKKKLVKFTCSSRFFREIHHPYSPKDGPWFNFVFL